MWIGKKSLAQSEAWHDLKYVIKKNYWLMILFLILFAVLIPFSTAGLPGDSMFNVEYTHDQVKYRFMHESVLYPVMVAAVLMGLICGLVLFRFLLNKRDTTMYLSLAVTRGRLFFNRMAAGCFICAVSIAVPMIISLLLNRAAVGIYMCEIRDCFYLIWGLLVLALVSFFITIAACMLSGTVAETLIYSIGLLTAPSMLFYSINFLAKQFFWGNAWGMTNWLGTETISKSLLERFMWANPILFFQKELTTHYIFVRPNENPVPADLEPKSLIGWTIVMLALAIAAYFLLRIRKAESAGISGTNPVLSEIMIGLSALLVFSLTVTFLGNFSVVMGLVFGFALFAVVHLFWRKSLFAYHLTKKRVLFSGFLQAIVPAAVCLVFAFFLPYISGKMLEKTDFRTVSVSFVGTPDYLYEPAAGSSSRGYYVESRVELENPDSIETAIRLHQLFLSEGKGELQLNEEEFSATVVPYDIVFHYVRDDGKEMTWYYDRASLNQLEELLALEDCSEVRRQQENVLTGTLSDSENMIWANEAYRNGAVFLTDSLYQNTWELSLDDIGREELLQAIAQDIRKQSLQDRYFSEHTAVATLMFSQDTEYDLTYYSYHLNNTFVYITDEFTNTINFLEKYGLSDLVYTQPEIESIVLQEFNPYDSVNGLQAPFSMYFMAYRGDSENEFLIQKDFGNQQIVTSEKRIEELRKVMHNNYFMSNGGYLAAVKLVNSDTWVYQFIPYSEAPDFLMRSSEGK